MSSPEFEQFERIADAQERQADALELIAGMLMVRNENAIIYEGRNSTYREPANAGSVDS